MIVTRVHPGPPISLDLHNAANRDNLLEWYRPPSREWLRLNVVVSVSGSAAGADGTSESLTNDIDRRILGVIRQLADVVLVGAQSVRVEGYRMPSRPALAIVTTSGDLTGHAFDVTKLERVLVFGPKSAAGRVRDTLGDATFLTIDEEGGRVSPTGLVRALTDRGLHSIVCEGGPTLMRQLLLADLVNELCLTTSPLLGAGSLPPFGREAFDERTVKLTQLLLDDEDTGYARWAVPGARTPR